MNICERKFTESQRPRESTLFGRLLVVGGSHWEAENSCLSIERYFPRLDCWKKIHELQEYRGLFGAVASDERTLIIIGGSDINRSSVRFFFCNFFIQRLWSVISRLFLIFVSGSI